MYSLRVTCASAECADSISALLWEAGTTGIQQIDHEASTTLIAAFEVDRPLGELTEQLAALSPHWQPESSTSEDWVAHAHNAWSARSVGERIFLAPPWCEEQTPTGRLRVIQNPGLACGTGEHPCTRLALVALEENMAPELRVADIGTGSGILAIAALRLGASLAIGLDNDESALRYARENCTLNGLEPLLVVGSADALKSGSCDLVAANISGTILLSLSQDLRRIVRSKGTLVLTGFPEHELPALQSHFPNSTVSGIDTWRCITVRVS
jgi:ribosomal protein L11 methyltransferase